MFLAYGVLWQQVTVSIRLFFTWLLCIYIILDEECYILYVFGLNNLSSDQVTYCNLPRKLIYDAIF